MTLEQSTIFIRGLRLRARHGVMEQERAVGAWFILDLRVHYNISRAMQTDNVAHTLSYADLLEVVQQQMDTPSQLLEHVAGRIGEAVFQRFPEATALHLRLTKQNPPMGADCDGAGVELHLTNN